MQKGGKDERFCDYQQIISSLMERGYCTDVVQTGYHFIVAMIFFDFFFRAKMLALARVGYFLQRKVIEKIESFGIMKKRITFVTYLQRNGKLLIENTSTIFDLLTALINISKQ